MYKIVYTARVTEQGRGRPVTDNAEAEYARADDFDSAQRLAAQARAEGLDASIIDD